MIRLLSYIAPKRFREYNACFLVNFLLYPAGVCGLKDKDFSNYVDKCKEITSVIKENIKEKASVINGVDHVDKRLEPGNVANNKVRAEKTEDEGDCVLLQQSQDMEVLGLGLVYHCSWEFPAPRPCKLFPCFDSSGTKLHRAGEHQVAVDAKFAIYHFAQEPEGDVCFMLADAANLYARSSLIELPSGPLRVKLAQSKMRLDVEVTGHLIRRWFATSYIVLTWDNAPQPIWICVNDNLGYYLLKDADKFDTKDLQVKIVSRKNYTANWDILAVRFLGAGLHFVGD